MTTAYARRRTLRSLEKLWTRLEILINRLVSPDFNPLYHLGTLGIFLLIVLTVTGLYLTAFYRPGSEVAYASTERITGQWLGGIMRSVHRYASDALLLAALLHALKTLLSDRFWGSRWLAWVSGVAMLVLSWALGTMGYWLVWDQRAQWLTELLINTAGGAPAVTFFRFDLASATFPAFIIVWFVHIFLPILLLALIVIHVVRLARARWWSPRWLMLLASGALIIVGFLRPAVSAPPADFDILIESVTLDWWYLGFLPLIDRWGSGAFWGVTLALFAAFTLLPWLARGAHAGPAVVENPNCTGCALCSAECPYRAIEMHYRSDDHERFKSIAVINADLCTGCGLCVGTCATLGIELSGLPTIPLYDQGVLAQTRSRVADGQTPVVLFTCERHAALGGARPSGSASPVVSAVVPCIGMVDADWVKELRRCGASDVILQSCPFDDCNYREGPQWTAVRFRRRKALLQPGLHWLEGAPGDRRALDGMLAGGAARTAPAFPDLAARKKWMPRLPVAALILLIVTMLFALASLPVEQAAGVQAAAQAEVRVVVEHPGVVQTGAARDVTLPEGATVDAAQILGGARHPVDVEIWIDGALAAAVTFEPKGARGVGEINGLAVAPAAPGAHDLQVRLRDDGGEWRVLFSGQVTLAQARALTLVYDHAKDIFVILER